MLVHVFGQTFGLSPILVKTDTHCLFLLCLIGAWEQSRVQLPWRVILPVVFRPMWKFIWRVESFRIVFSMILPLGMDMNMLCLWHLLFLGSKGYRTTSFRKSGYSCILRVCLVFIWGSRKGTSRHSKIVLECIVLINSCRFKHFAFVH